VRLWILIREISVSNSGRGISCNDGRFGSFSLLFRTNAEVVPRVEHDCVIANTFQICIYPQFYNSALPSNSKIFNGVWYVTPCSIADRDEYFDIISCFCLQSARMIMLFCVELILYNGRSVGYRNVLCQDSSSYPLIF
jgi:hypothetical protein